VIVTSSRPDGDPKRYRLQRVIQRACGHTKTKQPGSQQQE
jgi:hypothetical protein